MYVVDPEMMLCLVVAHHGDCRRQVTDPAQRLLKARREERSCRHQFREALGAALVGAGVWVTGTAATRPSHSHR